MEIIEPNQSYDSDIVKLDRLTDGIIESNFYSCVPCLSNFKYRFAVYDLEPFIIDRVRINTAGKLDLYSVKTI